MFNIQLRDVISRVNSRGQQRPGSFPYVYTKKTVTRIELDRPEQFAIKRMHQFAFCVLFSNAVWIYVVEICFCNNAGSCG